MVRSGIDRITTRRMSTKRIFQKFSMMETPKPNVTKKMMFEWK